MKIRTGFVSNSSSASFVIYGKAFTVDEMEKLAQANGYDDWDDFLESKKLLGVCDEYYVFVGEDIRSIRDDETMGEFKKSVEDQLVAAGLAKPDDKFEVHDVTMWC